jgi:glyoxalase family protein
MKPTIGGIHHITAIASDPQRNVDFYSGFLGLRLVKKTVNFDDPGTYHFYFGDYEGHPGTILTFFPWPGARRGRQGNGQVTVVSYAVPPGSLQDWQRRAASERLLTDIVTERFGERVLRLYDPDGLAVELIETTRATSSLSYFHSATLAVADTAATTELLSRMGFHGAATERSRTRYEIGGGGPGATVDLVQDPGAPRGLGGAGTVHHIAWRTPDDEQQLAWRSELERTGHHTTPVMDRMYFHSIYFREPGGILFEIATDPPGFTVDEPLETLGTRLTLPPWYEPMRDRIESTLPPVGVSADVSKR